MNKSKTKWLTAEEMRAWQGYRRMTRSLDARLARELTRDSGLSMQDYDVLSALTSAEDHRLSAMDLGAHLLWTASRLSHHLNRMQRRDLVRREHVADRRRRDVVLTPHGLDAIRGAAPHHVETVRQLFVDVLGREDLTALARITDTVRAGLKE